MLYNNTLNLVTKNNLVGVSFNLSHSITQEFFFGFLNNFVFYRSSLDSYINNILYRKFPYLFAIWSKFVYLFSNRCYYLHLYDSNYQYMGSFEFYISKDPDNFSLHDEFVSNFKKDVIEHCEAWMVSRNLSNDLFIMRVDRIKGTPLKYLKSEY